MRIETPRECERVGAVQIYGLQKVYELDAGLATREDSSSSVIQRICSDALYERQRDMAIIVPVKNERLKLIEGVLVGIPSPCQIIVVSNSPRESLDRFQLEKEAIINFCRFTNKKVLVVHQKDPQMAKAMTDSGYSEILDEDGLIRSGKAEGMILGTLLAKWLNKKYIGFVDSDNYFPGAVHEYVQEYAAGFEMFGEKNTFVRISWHSKPKIMENALFFAKWGRSSVHSNRALNKLLSHYSGYECETVKTGNAGEHALSLDLALNIEYAAGYAVETHHFINLLEMYGGLLDGELKSEKLVDKVSIVQIESRNPHLHESKGEDHVEDMIDASLSVVYHSPLCPELLRRELSVEQAARREFDEPAPFEKVRVYSNLKKVDLDIFLETCDAAFAEKTETLVI